MQIIFLQGIAESTQRTGEKWDNIPSGGQRVADSLVRKGFFACKDGLYGLTDLGWDVLHLLEKVEGK